MTKRVESAARHGRLSRRNLIKAGISIPLGALIARLDVAFGQQASFDYYISPSGSNSNAGTEVSPWALSALQTKGAIIAGKRIGLLPGTYVAPSGAEADYLRPAVNIVGGSAGSPTIVESVTPRAAVITTWNGSSYTCSDIAPLGTLNQHVVIRGLTVARCVMKGLVIGNSNVTVDGCEIYDLDLRRQYSYGGADNTDGIRVEDYQGRNSPTLTGVVIRNCKIHDIVSVTGGGTIVANSDYNCSGIKLYRTRGVLIENCTFYNINEGVFNKGYAGGTTVRNCHFYNVSAAIRRLGGDATAVGLTASAHNNFFYNVEKYHDAEVDFDTFQNLHIYNNTAYVNRSLPEGSGFYMRSTRNGLVRLYNNIVYAGPSASTGAWAYGVTDRNTNPLQFEIIDFNNYAGQFRNYSGSARTTMSAWRAAMAAAGGAEANSSTVDPLFERMANDPSGFRLQAGSPCRNAGRLGGTPGGAPVDLGCWTAGVTQIGCQFDASVVRPYPPVMQDVT